MMVSLKRTIAQTIAGAIGAARIFAPPKRGLRVLMYHAVESPADGDKLGLYTIGAARFEQQVSALHALAPDSVTDLVSGIGRDDRLRIAVTFDDGYSDNLRRAAPFLQKLGVPFTVFVCSDFVRNQRAHFLTVGELRELATVPGATIGSHGSTHRPLTRLDDATLVAELAELPK